MEEHIYVNYRSACLFQVKLNKKIKDDKNLCDQLKNTNLANYCLINRLRYEHADDTIETCKKIEFDDERENCFYNLAVKQINPEICTKYMNELAINYCYLAVGMLMNDTSGCDLIPKDASGRYLPPDLHNSCLSSLAIETGNDSICSLIPKESSYACGW